LNGDSDPVIKKTLDLLQTERSKKCLWLRLGKLLGAKLVRAAFAVILKHGFLLQDFIEVSKLISKNPKIEVLNKS